MPSLWDLLSAHIKREGISVSEFARRCGIQPGQFTEGKSIRGDSSRLYPETMRALSNGSGIPLVDLVVAAGIFTEEELNVPRSPRADTSTLTKAERLALVAELMVEPDELVAEDERPAAPAKPAASAPEFSDAGYDSTGARDSFPGTSKRGRKLTGRTRPHAVPDEKGPERNGHTGHDARADA